MEDELHPDDTFLAARLRAVEAEFAQEHHVRPLADGPPPPPPPLLEQHRRSLDEAGTPADPFMAAKAARAAGWAAAANHSSRCIGPLRVAVPSTAPGVLDPRRPFWPSTRKDPGSVTTTMSAMRPSRK